MLKILHARLQQYMNHELPDVQAGFRKGRGTRDQIANMCWIMEKAREFQKNIYFCFIDCAKAFDCVDHNKLWKNSERDGNTSCNQPPCDQTLLNISQKHRRKAGPGPGKNTGVGCHFLLQCMKVKSESEVAQSCLTLSDPMDWSLLNLIGPF